MGDSVEGRGGRDGISTSDERPSQEPSDVKNMIQAVEVSAEFQQVQVSCSKESDTHGDYENPSHENPSNKNGSDEANVARSSSSSRPSIDDAGLELPASGLRKNFDGPSTPSQTASDASSRNEQATRPTIEALERPVDAESTQSLSDDVQSTRGTGSDHANLASSITRLKMMNDTSPSREQWIIRKEQDRIPIQALDELMLMHGLESAKAHFLWVYDQVQMARKEGDDPRKRVKLHTCFVEDADAGEPTVVQLYIDLLQALRLVSYDKVMRLPSLFPGDSLHVPWRHAMSDGERGVLYLDNLRYDRLSSDLEELLKQTASSAPVIVLGLSGMLKDVEQLFPKSGPKTPPMHTILLRYTDDDFQNMLLAEINNRCQGKDVEGGKDGPLFKKFVGRVMNSGILKSRDLVLQFVGELMDRRQERIDVEARGRVPKSADHIFFTKSDMFGVSPEELGYRSEAWTELQEMIGMEKAKEAVRQLLSQESLNRRLDSEPTQTSFMRPCFIGPPGTGKTTAARLYGQVLRDIGLLDNGRIVEKRASDLIGQYIGHSEEKTKTAIDEAHGGVLIIDDFHLLLPDTMYDTEKTDSFRAAVIDTIVANVHPESEQREAVILVGYAESMAEAFERANPGLARRFPADQWFRLDPYDDAELSRLLHLKMQKYSLTASHEAIEVAMRVLSIARHRPNFGNGGDVENLIDKAKSRRNMRCAQMDVEAEIDMRLLPDDFDAHWDRSMDAASRCAEHFRDMEGMDEIMARFQRYQLMAARLRAANHDLRRYIPWAMVFRGPPGTGKTTVARKMGKIYYDMGFLADADLIECSVADLISQCVGGSGKKVIRMFERALGKVLFIDEAYRLGDINAVDAVGEIVDCMTKKRFFGNLIVILAGYAEDMDRLMRWNRGLRSRFETQVDFKPMRAADALALLQKCLAEVNIKLGSIETDSAFPWRGAVIEVLTQLARTKSWGNGRDVVAISRTVMEQLYTADEGVEYVEDHEGTCKKTMVFQAADLIPLLNQKLARAREEDEQMSKIRMTNGLVRFHDYQNRRQTSVDASEAKNNGGSSKSPTTLPGGMHKPGFTEPVQVSLSDLFPEEVTKHIFPILSKTGPLDEEDEKSLAALADYTTEVAERLSRRGDGSVVPRAAVGLWLKGLACLLRFGTLADKSCGTGQMQDHHVTSNKDDSICHLEQAYDLARLAIDSAPPNSMVETLARDLLSRVLFHMCVDTSVSEDARGALTDAAIHATRKALDADSSFFLDGEERDINARLGELLKLRYDISQSADDLNEAITCIKASLDMTCIDDGELPHRLQAIIDLYADRILNVRGVTMDHINHAIHCVTTWLELVDYDLNGRISNLVLAGRFFVHRFGQSQDGNVENLNQALLFQEQCLSLRPNADWNSSFRSMLLADCAHTLVLRFQAEGSIHDLNTAEAYAAEARGVEDMDIREKWRCTMALLEARSVRHELTLDEGDLEASLKEAKAVLRSDSLDDGARASMLDILCRTYTNRYRLSANEEDIMDAVECGQRAIDLYPHDANFVINMATAFLLLSERTREDLGFRRWVQGLVYGIGTGDAGDLEINRDLVHIILRIYRGNMGPEDLDEAISLAQSSLQKTPTHHKSYEMLTCDLAELLLERYDTDKERFASDLEEAIQKSKEASQLRMANVYYRLMNLQNLGLLMHRKYNVTGDENFLHKAIYWYELGWSNEHAAAAERIECGRAAANLLGTCGRWREAADILTKCVSMLPRVTGLASGDLNQQYVMARYGGLASSCSEALLNAGDVEGGNATWDAVRYLELGRSVISRLSLEQTVEVDMLKKKDRVLAGKYIEARTKLFTFAALSGHEDSEAISPLALVKQRRHLEIEKEYEAICEKIRQKPEFANFLLPPRPFEMQAAAGNGTIAVINVGKRRSDAFLISKSGVTLKVLGGVSEDSVVQAKGSSKSEMLDWMWWHVASPVLEEVATVNEGSWPRVWWILTGPLSGLPIHAAGSSSRDSVLDRVMSSYATSIMALLYARRITKPLPPRTLDSTQRSPDSAVGHLALLVSMRETPGGEYVDLPNADREIRAVDTQLRHGKLPVSPSILTDKRHGPCLAALRHSSVFHFAGHGRVDKQVPSQSALLLEDYGTRPLTIEAVRDSNGGVEQSDTPLFLAYLSACSTGTMANPDLVDETIHLVAGMQQAGFRHVVGTLWEVSDWYCVEMAVNFYTFLSKSSIGDDDVCWALHEATRKIRDKQFERPVFQATPQGGPSRLGVGSYPSETHVYPQRLSQGNVSNLEQWAPYVHFGV